MSLGGAGTSYTVGTYVAKPEAFLRGSAIILTVLFVAACLIYLFKDD